MGRLDERREHYGPFGSIPSVPAPLTRLIGRASELQAVGEMLRRARLVTLTGPAGVGKTRTAVELGRGQAPRRPDGVWLVVGSWRRRFGRTGRRGSDRPARRARDLCAQ